MASKRRDTPTDSMLEALSSWGAKNDLMANPTLNRLLNEIELGKNFKVWADLDPNTYLPNPEPNISNQKERQTNLITGIRNIMVFTPVAITWAAISVVTSEFSNYQNSNPNSVVNFLDFWQQGYGFVPDFWRLSNVAIFDVVLVALVIALTGAINFLNQRYLVKENAELTKINSDRLDLILDLNKYFYPYKYPTPNQINKNLLSATKSLDRSISTLTKIITRLEKDISKYPNSTKVIAELKDLNQTIKKLPKK